MRPAFVWAVFLKEWRDLLSNRLLLGAVAFPALIFAAIPTGLVAFIEVNDLDPRQLGQIEQYISAFPGVEVKTAAQAFIVQSFMAYFLLIPAMVPMAIATQSVIGEKVALAGAAAGDAAGGSGVAGRQDTGSRTAGDDRHLAGLCAYGLVNAWIADPLLTRFVFSDVWIVAMLTLVPLICISASCSASWSAAA